MEAGTTAKRKGQNEKPVPAKAWNGRECREGAGLPVPWSFRPGSRGLDADLFEASSGLRGGSWDRNTAWSFPGAPSGRRPKNPEYSSATATDSHRLPFLERSSNRLAWVSRAAWRVKARATRGEACEKSQGAGGCERNRGKGGKWLARAVRDCYWKRCHKPFCKAADSAREGRGGVVCVGFRGDVKKRTFPLTRVAALVKSVTSYPLAGLRR